MSATLLWALRSPCNLGCQYCYFGTVAEHGAIRDQLSYGDLSHFGGRDLPAAEALQFARKLTPATVRRVFIAGGEPLLSAAALPLVEVLKDAGIEVILCTNGLRLRDDATSERIVALGVDAVSVSLDSHNPGSNDRWRTDASGAGWAGVVDGITTLRDARLGSSSPRLGVYSVVTRINIAELVDTARFVDGLGVEYLVYQPISLDPAHRLAAELSLSPSHADELHAARTALEQLSLDVQLPDRGYLAMLDRSLREPEDRHVPGCFGGRELFFVQPDGSVWACPSSLKIASTRGTNVRTIRGAEPAEVFAVAPEESGDCDCYSVDCVNMWQLMAFDAVLQPDRTRES